MGIGTGAVGLALAGFDSREREVLAMLEAEVVDGTRRVVPLPLGDLMPPADTGPPEQLDFTWDGEGCSYDGPTVVPENGFYEMRFENRSSAPYGFQLASQWAGTEAATQVPAAATTSVFMGFSGATVRAMCVPLIGQEVDTMSQHDPARVTYTIRPQAS